MPRSSVRSEGAKPSLAANGRIALNVLFLLYKSNVYERKEI